MWEGAKDLCGAGLKIIKNSDRYEDGEACRLSSSMADKLLVVLSRLEGDFPYCSQRSFLLLNDRFAEACISRGLVRWTWLWTGIPFLLLCSPRLASDHRGRASNLQHKGNDPIATPPQARQPVFLDHRSTGHRFECPDLLAFKGRVWHFGEGFYQLSCQEEQSTRRPISQICPFSMKLA